MTGFLADWLPLIVASLPFIGGLLLYRFQRAVDRAHELQAERRRIYRDFVVASQKLRLEFARKRFDATSPVYFEYKYVLGELLVTVPDPVMNELMVFDGHIGSVFDAARSQNAEAVGRAIDSVLKQYLDVIRAMRLDTFPNTDFDPGKWHRHASRVPEKIERKGQPVSFG